MEAHKRNFLEFIGLSTDCFVIPVYQRNYDWKKENCKKLFDDIENICKKNIRTYFMGSIVTFESENRGAGSINNHLVIDGQQRITSLMLLILAVYNYLDETNEKTKFNKEILYKRYLVSEDFNGEVKVKLKSVKDDDDAFRALIHHKKEKTISTSSITINYNYFIDRIKNRTVTIDEIFNAIANLEVINIVLKRRDDDDPQLIFESLNSTGVSLSGADLIRNFLLINENEEKQLKFYTEFWNPMEVYTYPPGEVHIAQSLYLL